MEPAKGPLVDSCPYGTGHVGFHIRLRGGCGVILVLGFGDGNLGLGSGGLTGFVKSNSFSECHLGHFL